MGLVRGQGTYLRSGWNVYELIAALAGITDFIDIQSVGSSAVLLETLSVFRYKTKLLL